MHRYHVVIAGAAVLLVVLLHSCSSILSQYSSVLTESAAQQVSSALLQQQQGNTNFSCPSPTDVWYLTLHPCGGISNNRLSIMSAAMIAYYTNITLILPPVPRRSSMCLDGRPCPSATNNSSHWWKHNPTATMDYLYNVRHFQDELRHIGIATATQLPSCLEKFYRFGTFGKTVTQNKNLHIKHLLNYDGSLGAPRDQHDTCIQSNATKLKTNYPEWHQECQLGLINTDCAFKSFAYSKFDKYQWKQVFLAFRFSDKLYGLAAKVKQSLGPSYWSMHWRVEEDWYIYTNATATCQQFLDLGLVHHSSSKVMNSTSIFVAVGVSKSHDKVEALIKSCDATVGLAARFVFFQDLPVMLDLPEEMEIRAALQYLVCLDSHTHTGHYLSSFDRLLEAERWLRNGTRRVYYQPPNKSVDMFGLYINALFQ
jgi:hypothetical protein